MTQRCFVDWKYSTLCMKRIEWNVSLNSDAFWMYRAYILDIEPGQIKVETLHKNKNKKEYGVDKLLFHKFIFPHLYRNWSQSLDPTHGCKVTANENTRDGENLTFVYQCIASIIVNDDQQDATILAYVFIHNQLYMFWEMSSPIIRSTWLYLQLLILSTDITAGWCHGWDGTEFFIQYWFESFQKCFSNNFDHPGNSDIGL